MSAPCWVEGRVVVLLFVLPVHLPVNGVIIHDLHTEHMDDDAIRRAEGVYKQYHELPSATGGQVFLGDPRTEKKVVRVSVSYTQKDVENSRKNKFTLDHHMLLNEDTREHKMVVPGLVPTTWSSSTLLILPSPSNKFALHLVKEAGKKGNDPAYVFELYGQGKRIAWLDTSEFHGKIYHAGHPFGGMVWSVDETKVAYVAEQTKEERLKLFQKANTTGSTTTHSSPLRTEFEYEDDFGEQLKGAQYPRPYVLHLTDESGYSLQVEDVLQGQDVSEQKVAYGQIQFTPDSAAIVVVGWPIDKRRYGLIYYNTRPSSLYWYSINLHQMDSRPLPLAASHANIFAANLPPASNTYSCCNPRFSPNGTWLTYLTTRQTTLHGSCSSLCAVKVKDIVDRRAGPSALPLVVNTVVDYVDQPVEVDGVCGFCGLFNLGSWPARPFLTDDTVYFSSAKRSSMIMYCVNLVTKMLSSQPFPLPEELQANEEEGYGAQVFDVQDDVVLWRFSRVNCVGKVFLTKLNQSWGIGDSDGGITHFDLSPTVSLNSGGDITTRVITLREDNIAFQGILSTPRSAKQPPPLILAPHGGPHSVCLCTFNPTLSFFSAMGFAFLQVNYRGSIGFGLKSLDSLPGKVGTQDVSDCMAVLEEGLRLSASLTHCPCDKNALYVLGGSHGGFLTAHLIAQHPARWQAAAARNPVLNIPGEVVATDIPDWCYVESGAGVDLINNPAPHIPTLAQSTAMFKASPIANVSRVKCPLLLMVGSADVRVPWAQSFEYYHLLRAQGVPVKLLAYPGMQHALNDFPREEGDVWINVVMWFTKFARQNDSNNSTPAVDSH